MPELPDEVHRLIENRGLRFILCGSSARKLKRGRANVLGRPRAAPVVSTEPVEREVGGIRIVPWESALSRFRAGEIIAHRLMCDPQARMDLDTAKAIFARHAGKFITAYVFGSVAAGTSDEHSDIDVILVRDTARPFFDRVREIMDLRLEFGAADLLIYTPGELDEMLAEEGRYFVKHAVRTGHRIEGTQPRSGSVAQTSRP